MASVNRPGTMGPSTLESGVRIGPMAKEDLSMLMGIFTMDTGLMIKLMGVGSTST